jgi:hypothetical protein
VERRLSRFAFHAVRAGLSEHLGPATGASR